MSYSNYISSILFLFVVSVCCTSGLDTATVSITSAVGYSIQPACVQSCLYYNSFNVADYLLFGLGCTRLVEIRLGLAPSRIHVCI